MLNGKDKLPSGAALPNSTSIADYSKLIRSLSESDTP